MKLKFLDYIPGVSWINTYRRIKQRRNSSEEKTQHVYDDHNEGNTTQSAKKRMGGALLAQQFLSLVMPL